MRHALLMLPIASLTALFACSGGEEAPPPAPAEPAPAANAGNFEMNIGSLAPVGSPWRTLLEKMEKEIETESGGRINVILRPPGVMSEVELVRETREGVRVQGAGVTTAAIAEGGNVPEMQLVELPYLFRNNAEADHVLDNVLFEPMGESLKKKGFILGMWSENGWRSFATRGKPILKPEDLAGFKMRSQESDVHMAMYAAFGAQAVQKPMTEVLTALQSNLIDGLDNTALYIAAGGLAEPLDHFVLTKHIYQPAAIIFSRKFYDGLPPDLQAIVAKQKGLTVEGRTLIREEDALLTEVLAAEMTITELSPEQLAPFEAKAKTMHADFAAKIEGGPELLAKINTAVEQVRAAPAAADAGTPPAAPQ